MRPKWSSEWLLFIALIASLAFLPGAAVKEHGNKGKSGQAKFRGLDRNNDGRITRDEWRGNDRSFSVHDRNGDGVIAGAEVGAALEAEGYDDFLDIDRNRDGRISGNEWLWDRAEFDRMDDNRDGTLSRPEYLGTNVDGPDAHFPDARQSSASAPTSPAPSALEDRNTRFSRLDRNGNGAISRDEWDGDRKSFDVLDDNDNGALSRDEFMEATPEARKAMFKGYDRNGNGIISRSEWTGDRHSFGRLDVNDDGKLMREEFVKRYDELENNFTEMDRDRDGRVSRAEWRGDKKAFAQLDDNRDEYLSLAEFVGTN